MKEEEMKQDLEKHLHEQYAINDNAHTTSLIAFVTAFFALFGAYGYVYAKIGKEVCSHCCCCSGIDMGAYTIDEFSLLTMVVVGVLCFLSILCVFVGYAQRRDQILIQNIRNNYGLKTNFGNAEDKNCCHFIPDYYNAFYWLFVIAQGAVWAMYCIKIWCACEDICSCWTISTGLITIIFIHVSLYFRSKYYKKYKNKKMKVSFEKSGITYQIISEDKIEVTDLSKLSGDISLPVFVDYNKRKYPVHSIAVDAFKNCPEVKSITISEGTTTQDIVIKLVVSQKVCKIDSCKNS